jgi:hypothetical protein
MQIAASYLFLGVALLISRSERTARWTLGVVAIQVLSTFITCQTLPHVLASVLEIFIPYVAIIQLLINGFLLGFVLHHERFRKVTHAAA